jgi:S-disulfanyl-L-cysteine oxidoreductase SoxD
MQEITGHLQKGGRPPPASGTPTHPAKSSILSFAVSVVFVLIPWMGNASTSGVDRNGGRVIQEAGSKKMAKKKHVKTRGLVFLSLVALGVCWAALHAQERARSVWDGVYTLEQARDGEMDYNRQCARCHGDMLEGDDEAPALADAGFLSNWNGLTVGDLFERIRTTMPYNNPEGINREAKLRIVAYILSYNGFPAGDGDLSSRTELLKLIRIDAAQPKK